MKTEFNYVIIKTNNPYLETENVLLKNKYNKKAKYAFIQKMCHKDGSESIAFIDYSNNLEDLQNRASGFESWYNYPIGFFKARNGSINKL